MLPQIRQFQSPLTEDQLAPLDPRCKVAQFGNRAAFTDVEYRRMGEFLSQYPHIRFRVYSEGIQGLEFLKYFQFLKSFQVDSWSIANLDGLRFLSVDLKSLAVGRTKSKRFSLKFLERFSALKDLAIEGHTKDFAAVGTLTHLEALTLRSITLPDLSALTRLHQLDSLAIKLGGTTNLGLLPQIGRLRHLELWMVRGLTDVSPIADLKRLQYLFLQALKQVTTLPSFAKLQSLRRVHLLTMKRLRDLSPIRDAPALEDLIVLDMPQLTAEAFRPFIGHPKLRAVRIALGSSRKSNEAYSVLNLPKVEGKFLFSPDGGQS